MLKGSLYYYIQSKEDLLCQVILDTIDTAEASLLRNEGGRKDANDIRSRIRTHFAYLCDHHIGLAFLLREADQLPRARRAAIKNRVEQYERALAETLLAGQFLGVVRPGNPDALVQIMLASSTWASWGGGKREALLNGGVLHMILSQEAAPGEPRPAKSSRREAIALAAGRGGTQFEPSPALSS